MVHALVESIELSCETDRARFLGRAGTPRSPRALRETPPLSGTTGAVLAPIFGLRTVARLEPGGGDPANLPARGGRGSRRGVGVRV
jgi:cyclic beta-1,2-glucan synthetase